MLLAIEYCENSDEILKEYGRAIVLLNMLEDKVINKPLIEKLGNTKSASKIIRELFLAKKIDLLKIKNEGIYNNQTIKLLYQLNDYRVSLSHGFSGMSITDKKIYILFKDKEGIKLETALKFVIKNCRYLLANQKKLENLATNQ